MLRCFIANVVAASVVDQFEPRKAGNREIQLREYCAAQRGMSARPINTTTGSEK